MKAVALIVHLHVRGIKIETGLYARSRIELERQARMMFSPARGSLTCSSRSIRFPLSSPSLPPMPRHVADIHSVLSLIRATPGRKESRKNELTALLHAASPGSINLDAADRVRSLSLSRSVLDFFSAPRKRARRGTRYIRRPGFKPQRERIFQRRRKARGSRGTPSPSLPLAFGPLYRVIS